MKKNKLFILGLVTVFVALVSLTLVSSTWAKYTTTQSGSDSARVAYWGFNSTADLALNLFEETDGTTVKSAVSGQDVIAPGTKGDCTVQLAYAPNADGKRKAPEVAYKVTYVLSEANFTDNLQTHPNILFTVKIGGVAQPNAENKTWEKLPKEFIKDYAAGENAENITIEWKWIFDDTDGENEDVFDTQLGNAGEAVCEVVVTITATQVD